MCAETLKDPYLKERILNASLELMSKRGISGTTLGDIAQRCDISRGTLYYHYRSKDELIVAINEWNIEELTGDLLEMVRQCCARGQGLEQILIEAFTVISGAAERGKIHLHLLNEALSRDCSLIERLRGSYRHWFSIMEDALTQLLPAEKDCGALARALVASLDGMIIQGLLNLDDIPMERLVPSLINGLDEDKT